MLLLRSCLIGCNPKNISQSFLVPAEIAHALQIVDALQKSGQL
jgi:hypothetical protein